MRPSYQYAHELMVRLRGVCGVSGVVCWGRAIGCSGERLCTYTQGLHGHGPGWAWIQGDQVSTNSYTIGKAVGRGSPGAHPPLLGTTGYGAQATPARGVPVYVKVGTTTKVHFWGYRSVDLFRKCNRMRDFTGVI